MKAEDRLRELEDRIETLEKQLGELTSRIAWLLEVSIDRHRAFGEDYLYSKVMDHDIMALSDYVKVDARTLQLYLRKGYEKYKMRFA